MGKRLVADGRAPTGRGPVSPDGVAFRRSDAGHEAGAGAGYGAPIGLVLAAWADLDRLLTHVPDAMAIRQPGPGRASVALTVGHLANQVDSWIDVRFAGLSSHPLLSADVWRIGGDGSSPATTRLANYPGAMLEAVDDKD